MAGVHNGTTAYVPE